MSGHLRWNSGGNSGGKTRFRLRWNSTGIPLSFPIIGAAAIRSGVFRGRVRIRHVRDLRHSEPLGAQQAYGRCGQAHLSATDLGDIGRLTAQTCAWEPSPRLRSSENALVCALTVAPSESCLSEIWPGGVAASGPSRLRIIPPRRDQRQAGCGIVGFATGGPPVIKWVGGVGATGL